VAQPPEFRPRRILEALVAHGVDFVLMGGLAGVARGSSYPSYDIDIAYARDDDNLERLAAALRKLEATLRDAPAGLPFVPDAGTLRAGSHFTFSTPYGSLDLLSDSDGVPHYADLKRAAGEPANLEGAAVHVASLDHLIAMKERSGRTKDRLMATEYRVLADELRRSREEDERA
jgi:hypothetical protein